MKNLIIEDMFQINGGMKYYRVVGGVHTIGIKWFVDYKYGDRLIRRFFNSERVAEDFLYDINLIQTIDSVWRKY